MATKRKKRGPQKTTGSHRGGARRSAASKRSQPAGRVASGTNGKGTDVLALLKQDHDRVKKLFRRFEGMKDSADGEELRELVEEACAALTVHAELEEELFYPRARESIREDELIDEAEVEHASAKQLISQIEGMDPEDPKYSATFTVLTEYVKHHIQEEEKELFPQVRKARVNLKELGAEAMQRREELMEEHGMEVEPAMRQVRGVGAQRRRPGGYRESARA
jgi:hemerythrin superfamily protein